MVEAALPTELGPRARSILEAARACFGRYGFQGASMMRIAEAAGISVGHIYRYFASKEAVVAAIAEQDLLEKADDLRALRGDPHEIAAKLLDGLEERTSPQSVALRLEVLAEAARNPRVAALTRAFDVQVREHLRDALIDACGAGRAAAPECIHALDERVQLIAVLMEGLMLRRFQQEEPLSPVLLDQVRAILAQALSPPAEASAGAGRSAGESGF